MIVEQTYCAHCYHYGKDGCDVSYHCADRLIACVEAGWRETVPPYKRTDELILFGECHTYPASDFGQDAAKADAWGWADDMAPATKA